MGKKQDVSALAEAVEILGGYAATGRICEVSGKAVEKWVKAGRLPRTEATRETNYAERMNKADPRINKDRLLATLFQQSA